MILKRIFDIFFALIFISFFSILFLLITFVIYIDVGSPVIYRAKRVGKNKKTFICYKFLTMKNINGKDTITRSGVFLRNSNLDELPQFFNVLFGSMSVVGPRPHDFEEDKYFSANILNYDDRFSFKPGITGFAGIKGNRGGSDLNKIEKRLKLDMFYINNYSFFLDIKIIFFTIYLTLTGKKSI